MHAKRYVDWPGFSDGGEPVVIFHRVEGGWSLEDHEALRDYLAAHAFLDEEQQAGPLPESRIEQLATRLDAANASLEDKQRVLIVLAHQGSYRAVAEIGCRLGKLGPDLERFARLAFEEAEQWLRSSMQETSEDCEDGCRRAAKACGGAGNS